MTHPNLLKLKRQEQAAEAAALRATGLTYREIGERMGITTKRAGNLVWDPTGSKARKHRDDFYAQRGAPCVDCGVHLSGRSDGTPPTRCQSCEFERRHKGYYWTQERVVEAIREWVDLYGEPPAIPDWNPYDARHVLHDEARARRWEEADGRWPWFTHVVRRFGTWNAAIESAGYDTRAAHGGDGNEARRRNQRAKAA